MYAPPLIALVALFLACGCAATYTHRLKEGMPAGVWAEFTRGLDTSRLVVRLASGEYAGDVKVTRYAESGNPRDRDRFMPRQLNSLLARRDEPRIVNAGTAHLHTAAGAELRCDLRWAAGDRPAGACIDDAGARHELNFD